MALEMQTNNKKKMPWIPTSMTGHNMVMVVTMAA